MTASILQAITRCRAAEKEQSLYYRYLAAAAEERGDEEMSQRFHDLHADEQHHLSRLTARLLELGEHPPDLSQVVSPRPDPKSWEAETRRREAAEVSRYEAILHLELDETTRELISEILGVERQHASELGGKWTPA